MPGPVAPLAATPELPEIYKSALHDSSGHITLAKIKTLKLGGAKLDDILGTFDPARVVMPASKGGKRAMIALLGLEDHTNKREVIYQL